MEALEAARYHGSGTDSPRIQAADAKMKDKRQKRRRRRK
jgi:hypothetical protein